VRRRWPHCGRGAGRVVSSPHLAPLPTCRPHHRRIRPSPGSTCAAVLRTHVSPVLEIINMYSYSPTLLPKRNGTRVLKYAPAIHLNHSQLFYLLHYCPQSSLTSIRYQKNKQQYQQHNSYLYYIILYVY
jgi:hypothetical protein